MARYVFMGLFLGATLVLGAWIFELERGGLSPSLDGVATIHRHNQLLLLIDFAPLIAIVLFYKIGRVQARLHRANIELEDRVRDRTEQITLEKARSSAIFDTAADGMITFLGGGEIQAFNHSAHAIFGYRAEEAIGRSIRTIVNDLDWNNDDLYARNASSSASDLAIGQSLEYEGLRKDGTTIPVEIEISRFLVKDELSYTAIVRDISERRRQERLQRSLIEMTGAVNQCKDLESLYRSIHNSLTQVMQITRLCIAIYQRSSHSFEFPYVIDERSRNPRREMTSQEPLLSMVLDKGRVVLLGRRDYEQLVADGKLKAMLHPFTSWLGAPLINLGQSVGVIVIQSQDEELIYGEREVWIMEFVSSQIANAIDREQARESLRQSEKRYRQLVEEAGDTVYTLDLEGIFTYVNPKTVRLTGFDETELIGKSLYDLVTPALREKVRQAHEDQVKETRRESVVEFPIQRKDGGTVWLEENMTLLVEEDRPRGYQAIVHDVTQRRHAEEAMREREERFRSLSASSPIGIFQLDQKGNCTYVNSRFEEIVGASQEQCLGAGWIDAIHPEERETFRTEWIFAREESQSAAREVRVSRPNGEERWVNIRWSATLNALGRISGYVGTFEDITQRKRTERVGQVLYEISQAVQNTEDIEQFFASLHRSLAAIIDTTNFYIALYDEETQMIQFPYAREEGKEKPLAARRIGKGLTAMVLRTGTVIHLDEKGLQNIYRSGEAVLIGQPAKNWLGVPLISGNKVIGAVIIQSYTDARHYTAEDVQTMNFVSSQIATAIEKKQMEEASRQANQQLAEAHRRITEDLAAAARIQRARLPKSPPPVTGVEFSWLFESCEEVAGDMFNFVMLNDHEVGIYIFDVSGHGVSAALMSMALSRALTATSDGSGVLLSDRNGTIEPANPAEVAARMNERFPMNLDTNQYFTLLYGILDVRELSFRFVRGGHPAPILINESGARALDECCGPAIGLIARMKYQDSHVQLQPGDSLVLFTDGVDEASDLAGEEFGIERILDSLGADSSENIENRIARLRGDMRQFMGHTMQYDDITIVGLRILDKAAPNGSDLFSSEANPR